MKNQRSHRKNDITTSCSFNNTNSSTNDKVYSAKRNYNDQRTYDNIVYYNDLMYKKYDNFESGISKRNFDKLTKQEICMHDYLLCMIQKNIDIVLDNVISKWNEKKIVFIIDAEKLLSTLKQKFGNIEYNLNDIFTSENNNGKKIVAINLFKSLNKFDKKDNSRNSYGSYIITGCSIVADENTNNWKVLLYTSKV
jgi:hypothetical protein